MEEKIDTKDVKQALLRSGYLLESRIETLLTQDDQYHVEANYAYPDPNTGISRELDIHATTVVEVKIPNALGVFGTLLIECVNNPQPIALITKERKEYVSSAVSAEIKVSGLPVKLLKSSSPEIWTTLAQTTELRKKHHYSTGRIATQFCSFTKKKKGDGKGEWMALHDENHFDAFRKLSDVVEYEMERHYKTWFSAENRYVDLEYYYPIVVVQGDLLDVRVTKRALRATKANHLKFKRTCVSGNRTRSYIIDVVRETYLKEFLAMVSSEIEYVASFLGENAELVNTSVNTIVDQVLSLPPEKRRHAAESPWYSAE